MSARNRPAEEFELVADLETRVPQSSCLETANQLDGKAALIEQRRGKGDEYHENTSENDIKIGIDAEETVANYVGSSQGIGPGANFPSVRASTSISIVSAKARPKAAPPGRPHRVSS